MAHARVGAAFRAPPSLFLKFSCATFHPVALIAAPLTCRATQKAPGSESKRVTPRTQAATSLLSSPRPCLASPARLTYAEGGESTTTGWGGNRSSKGTQPGDSSSVWRESSRTAQPEAIPREQRRESNVTGLARCDSPACSCAPHASQRQRPAVAREPSPPHPDVAQPHTPSHSRHDGHPLLSFPPPPTPIPPRSLSVDFVITHAAARRPLPGGRQIQRATYPTRVSGAVGQPDARHRQQPRLPLSFLLLGGARGSVTPTRSPRRVTGATAGKGREAWTHLGAAAHSAHTAAAGFSLTRSWWVLNTLHTPRGSGRRQTQLGRTVGL